MFNWANIAAQEAHRHEFVREAELDRLARQAQTRSRDPAPRPSRPRLGIRQLLIAKRPRLISG